MTNTSLQPTYSRALVLGFAALISLTGCATDSPAAPAKPAVDRPQKPSSSDPETAGVPTLPGNETGVPTVPGNETGVPTVPGYEAGDFPPVPLFRLPDLSLLDGSASSFTIEINQKLLNIPGVTTTAAECGADGSMIMGDSIAYLYGDGSGSYVGPKGVIENFGDGSGSYVGDGIVIENDGKGAGSYVGGDVVIENLGDGSGSYVGNDIVVEIDGNGAGSYVGGGDVIENNGDGSGHYTGNGMVIENNGDGTGSYVGDGLEIENNGDGTADVNGTRVEVAPLAPVPRLGSFAPIGALAPIESCGTLITFEDDVLFDFGKDNIRPDAAEALETVARALTEAEIAQAEVSGHTDSIGSDSYNQELSERRADSVVDALTSAGVTTTLTATGYGESRPVAANEIDGVDNPAGRQLNRRVEIFIPTSL